MPESPGGALGRMCGPLGALFREPPEPAISDPENSYWRQGRKVGRTTIYAVLGGAYDKLKASDDDPLIGVMDTPELAAEAVRAHNERKALGDSR